MLALSDPHKTRPYQPKHCPPPLPVPGLALHSSGLEPSPGAPRRVGSGSRVPMHERSHSDTPASLPPPVDLSAESSSVTSLSNLQPLRKTLTSGEYGCLVMNWFEARCCPLQRHALEVYLDGSTLCMYRTGVIAVSNVIHNSIISNIILLY